ncbi:unnamed protein product, partial [marine sediment metagenome]
GVQLGPSTFLSIHIDYQRNKDAGYDSSNPRQELG